MLRVAAVYRSGGDYDPSYFTKLFAGVERHLTREHEKILLVDDRVAFSHPKIPPFTVSPLEFSWPGWWSKIELFRLLGPVLYLDLDTVITGSLDPLADAICAQDNSEVFWMLRGFYKQDRCSGVMGWNGDYRWLTDAFIYEMNSKPFMWWNVGNSVGLTSRHGRFRGDQEWIRARVGDGPRRIESRFVQDALNGVLSFKVDLRGRKCILPAGASMVVFHGKPRPHEVPPPVPDWLREHWSP